MLFIACNALLMGGDGLFIVIFQLSVVNLSLHTSMHKVMQRLHIICM